MLDDFKTIVVMRDGPVMRLRLNSPETGNAVDGQMLDELLTVLGLVHDEPGIRVLELSGAGPDFCLGGDRREFARLMNEDPTGARVSALSGKARRVFDALATTGAVTIARLHGGVIGAGFALALFCDLRVGADNSRYRLPELALGLPVGWGVMHRFIQEVGAARIREVILTGVNFDAAMAHRLSVLHRIVPESELDRVVGEWARPIARRSPAALRATKATMNAYSSATRFADVTLLEDDLMAAVVAAGRAPRGGV